jgi:hypothetical protein
VGGGIATGAAAAMDKGKRAKVEEEEGSELDAELVMAIEKLQEVQDELERVRANPRLPSLSPLLSKLSYNLATRIRNGLGMCPVLPPVPDFLCFSFEGVRGGVLGYVGFSIEC